MVCSLVALSALFAAIAYPQAAAPQPAADKPVTLADILKNAGCPLTADQAKKIAELDLSKGREAFQGINAMFDEKQMTALKKELGTRAGRNGGPETPRYLTQLIVFEKGKCPLTQKQLAAIMKIEPGQGSYQQVNDLLTDAQKAEMQKVMPRRQ
jgi:hypothetical protein